MSIPTRTLRALAAAAVASVVLLAGLPGPAAALEPPRPLPGYSPTFVTETDARPWQDCLWASGAMLLDKWTSGQTRVTRQALRALSSDAKGGSSFADLKVAYAKVGINLQYSPDGGVRITWAQLLSRLEHGAGAILLGDDSKLPRYYGRWDIPFWKATGDGDNHAVYIERYDRKRGRAWLMDPLGQGRWKGEWIKVSELREYAWTSGGALSVAVTPNAQAAPFQGVTVSGPTASVTSTALDIGWSVKAPRGWRFPGADVMAAFEPVADPLAAAAAGLAAASAAAGDPPLAAAATFSAPMLHATAPLPTTPGAYQATVTVIDRRFGRAVASSSGTTVFVPGSRSAAIRLRASNPGPIAGTPVTLTLVVANTGELTWADLAPTAGALTSEVVRRSTRLVGYWVPIDVPVAPATSPADPAVLTRPGIPDPVDLGGVSLEPGRLLRLDAEVTVPSAPGTWVLVVDVVDDVDGSFAALGSAPGAETFKVGAAPDIAWVDRLPSLGGSTPPAQP